MFVRVLNKLLWLSALALLCLAYGFFVEPKRLVIIEVEIVSPSWDQAPLRIGLLSDVHVGGRLVHAERAEMNADRMNELAPDIVLLTGDYTSGTAPKDWRGPGQVVDVERGHAALGSIKSALGTFAVLGNHDHQYGAPQVRENLEEGGITFVDNPPNKSVRP